MQEKKELQLLHQKLVGFKSLYIINRDSELNLTFSDDDTLQFNECVARCFFIAENECTTELKYGIPIPKLFLFQLCFEHAG